MAYNGSGQFSLPYSWVNDASNGIAITASRMDTQFDNCVQGFDLVICRDGQSTITGDIPWGGFRLTGLGAATTAGDALSYGGAAVLAATVITSASANALDVGPNGATNPVLQVDASTSSAATGLKIKAAAAAGGFALSVLSSGTDENLTIDAKGAGAITLGASSTGAVVAAGVNFLASQITLPNNKSLNTKLPGGATVNAILLNSSTEWQIGDNSANGSFHFHANGGEISNINGSTGVYTATSDARLATKMDMQTDWRSVINSLWVGDVRWNTTGQHSLKMFAQDLYAATPDHVGAFKPEGDGAMGIEQQFPGYLALWGVKDLYAEIAALRSEIANLRAGV